MIRTGPFCAVLIADGAGAADHLLGRDAVNALRIDAHEILPAAGDDVRAVADAAKIFEKLDLRRIDEFGVRPLPARIARFRDPFGDLVAERVDVHAGQGRGGDLDQRLEAQLRDRFAIPRQHGAERLDLGKLGLRLHQRRHAIEAIDELRIDRMLDPQRAVLVEGRDPLRKRHEAWACGVSRRMDEFDDRILRRPGIPRGQGIVFGVRPPGEAERSRPAEHKRREFAPAQFHLELEKGAA